MTHNTSDDRFWVRVRPTGFCWEWTGRPNKGGYGQVTRRGKPRLVHRLAYEMLVGPIPEGLDLDHLCRNTICVNPDHLEPVTNRENTMRSFNFIRFNAEATHCPEGHEYAGLNLYVTTKGWRECRTCKRERNRRYERNRRAKAA